MWSGRRTYSTSLPAIDTTEVMPLVRGGVFVARLTLALLLAGIFSGKKGSNKVYGKHY